MKKLFIYYSYTGSGDVVAQKRLEKGCEVRKVETVKGLPKVFFFAMLSGGFQAGTKKKAKLKEFDYDISAYEEVVIGSPIWNGRIAPAINTVLANINFEGKELSFIFYAGSGEGKNALKRVSKEYPNAKCVFLKQPKDHPEELKKLD